MRVAVSREAVKGALGAPLPDFHSTEEGDVLMLPALVCEGAQENRDHCGCGRAFAGLAGGACTTAVVEERDEAEVFAALWASPSVRSWGPDLVDAFESDMRQLSEALEHVALGTTVRIESTPGHWALLAEVTS